MNWIKIEDGCEMPRHLEIVAIAKMDAAEPWWSGAVYIGGISFEESGSFERSDLTHWARVELPDGN